MPGLSGIETAAAIRERERSRHIPIIFLTGMDKTQETMFQGYSAGAVDYLVKPIQTDVLIAKVGVFIELAQARQRLHQEVEERTKTAVEISMLNQALEDKNRELESRTAKLQETVQELERYSYSISHDMRAPLRAMKGYADVLIEEAIGHALRGAPGVPAEDFLRRAAARPADRGRAELQPALAVEVQPQVGRCRRAHPRDHRAVPGLPAARGGDHASRASCPSCGPTRRR